PVAKLLDCARASVDRMPAYAGILILTIGVRSAVLCNAMGENVTSDVFPGCSDLQQALRQQIYLRVAGIPDNEPPPAVEHADTLGHVAQRSIEAIVDDLQLGGFLRYQFLLTSLLRDILVGGDPAAFRGRRALDRDLPAIGGREMLQRRFRHLL